MKTTTATMPLPTRTRINILSAISLSLILGAAVCSCSSKDTAPATGPDTGKTQEAAADVNTRISFSSVVVDDTYRLDGSAADYQSETDVNVKTTGSMLIPTYVNGSDINILRRAIVAKAFGGDANADSPDKAMKEYFKALVDSMGYKATAYAPDSLPAPGGGDGIYSISGDVASMSPAILSYAISENTYYPHAANGSTKLSYVNYGFAQGKVLQLTDLFTADGLKALPAEIANRVSGIGVEAKNVKALPADGSFYVDYLDRLVFVYQAGEIGPYSAGAVTATFYPGELYQYLTPEAVSLFNLQ